MSEAKHKSDMGLRNPSVFFVAIPCMSAEAAGSIAAEIHERGYRCRVISDNELAFAAYRDAPEYDPNERDPE